MTTVLKRQDQSPRPRWLHYLILDDDKATTTLVELTAAVLSGWNVRSIESAPMARDWPGMKAADIVGWKKHNARDACAVDCEADEASRIVALVASKAGVQP